jgi:zinc protease
VEKRTIPAWDAQEWILANGARVIVKPTDFMEDQVLFYAVSPGGLSLEGDDFYHDGLYSLLFLQESGLADFSAGDLRKVLSGRDVSVFPYLGDYFEGFSGGGSPTELETLLQLTRLYFTQPRFDQGVYANLKERLQEVVKNRLADPVTEYRDTIQEILSSGAYRRKPLDPALLETIYLEEGREVYRRRFSGAGDFTFIFAGALDPEVLEPLVAAYLGNLPAGPKEAWQDRGIRPPDSSVDERVKRGLEPQGRLTLIYHGEGEFSSEDEKILGTVSEILEVNLRELIREELGGTYSVRASVTSVKQPYSGWTAFVELGCDPERVDELTDQIEGEIAKLQSGDFDPSHLEREKEQYRRTYEVNLRENGFWLNSMARAVREGTDPEPPMTPGEYASLLTRERIVDLAGRIFDSARRIRVVLVPAEEAPIGAGEPQD